jgi:hypothetical protein
LELRFVLTKGTAPLCAPQGHIPVIWPNCSNKPSKLCAVSLPERCIVAARCSTRSCTLLRCIPRCRGRVGNALAPRCDHQATKKECCGKNDLDRARRRERAKICYVLSAVMQTEMRSKNEGPSLLEVVALLTDVPAQRLARGQVGTIVEQLDDRTLLVEFSDDQGRAYAVAPCARRIC